MRAGIRSLMIAVLAAFTTLSIFPRDGASPAFAAGGDVCDAYVRETVAKAHGVRGLECGYDLKDRRWAVDRDGHARWCKAASKDVVVKETAQRRGQVKLCQVCRAYATLATRAAADNDKLKCGFAGPRWSKEAAAHFGWCMALRNSEDAIKASAAGSSASITAAMENSIAPEASDRIREIDECRERQAGPQKAPPGSGPGGRAKRN